MAARRLRRRAGRRAAAAGRPAGRPVRRRLAGRARPGGGAVGFHALPPLAAGGLVELTRSRDHLRRSPPSAPRSSSRALGRHVEWVGDAPGPRARADRLPARQRGVLRGRRGRRQPDDVDAGMVLGLNHPRGPLAWGDAIGSTHVLAVLDALRVEHGEERYRAAPLLRRLAPRAGGIATGRASTRRVLTTARRRVLPVTPPPFQRFLDEHRDDVWRFLVAAVGRDAADDCFQETFLAALRAYPRPRVENPRAWVLTIAHRKALDHHRAQARRRAGRRGARRPAAAGAEPGGDVWERVRELPPKQRAALLLRYAGDLSHREVGRGARLLGGGRAAARPTRGSSDCERRGRMTDRLDPARHVRPRRRRGRGRRPLRAPPRPGRRRLRARRLARRHARRRATRAACVPGLRGPPRRRRRDPRALAARISPRILEAPGPRPRAPRARRVLRGPADAVRPADRLGARPAGSGAASWRPRRAIPFGEVVHLRRSPRRRAARGPRARRQRARRQPDADRGPLPPRAAHGRRGSAATPAASHRKEALLRIEGVLLGARAVGR